jgi:hypothetical protein
MGLEGDTTGILDVIPNQRRLGFAIEKLEPQRKNMGRNQQDSSSRNQQDTI